MGYHSHHALGKKKNEGEGSQEVEARISVQESDGFASIGPAHIPPVPSGVSPERTVHMAAKAFILRAFISLLAQRQMASTHMRRNPMARSPMYTNSLMTESHRTPERETGGDV